MKAILDLESGNWYDLGSGVGEATCEIPSMLKDMQNINDDRFYDLADSLASIIQDQCAYTVTIATFPYLVDILKNKENKKQEEKLMEMLTVCIAWETKEILDTVDLDIRVPYLNSKEELKRYARIFFEKYALLWDAPIRRFWAIAYAAILGEKTWGSILIGNYSQCEIYCNCCGYEGEINFTGDKEYEIDNVDCMDKDDFDWFRRFISEKDEAFKRNKMFAFYENYQCPQCGTVKKVIEFAKDYSEVR